MRPRPLLLGLAAFGLRGEAPLAGGGGGRGGPAALGRHLGPGNQLVEPGANWSVPTYRVGGGAELVAATAAQGLEGVIAKDGTIEQLRLLSGHPLLAPAALAAVKQWHYRPTLLNGEPVEVVAPIEVHFVLSH